MKDSVRPADAFSGPRRGGLLSLFMGRPEPSSSTEKERKRSYERVLNIVKRNFPVIAGDFDNSGIFIKVIWDPKDSSDAFERVRAKLRSLGFFPKLVENGNETVLAIFPLPKRGSSKITTNIILLILTVFTTVWAGASLWEERRGGMIDSGDIFRILADPVDMVMGALTFAFPLLLILGTHELGHYFASRRYDVDASLPYFIPIPPVISPFGTFGALISMKEPISNKKALVDIGAAGPIAGFIVAIPVTIIGLMLTGIYPSTAEMVEGLYYININPPLLFRGIMSITGISLESDLYPTAIAGWIGLFVTSINLFPAGQLDGGHIARGALGERGKFLSFLTVAGLLVLGVLTPFKTYLIFAFLILLMGTRHPPPLDDVTNISKRQVMTAIFAVLIFIVTFHPLPLEIVEAQPGGVIIVDHPEELNISSERVTTFKVVIENPGRLGKDVALNIIMENTTITYDALRPDPEWNETIFGAVSEFSSAIYIHDGWYLMAMDPVDMRIPGGEGKNLTWDFAIGCSENKVSGEAAGLQIGFSTENEVAWSSIEMVCVN